MTRRINFLFALLIGLAGACSTKTDRSNNNADSVQTIEAGANAALVRPGPEVKYLLQGNWQSTTDPGDTFTIKGSTLLITHTDQQPLLLAFTYVADCGGVCDNRKSSYGCFITQGQFDIDCQAIVHISNTELEVTQGNTGQTTRYRKKP